MYWNVPTSMPSLVSFACSIVISVRAEASGEGPDCLLDEDSAVKIIKEGRQRLFVQDRETPIGSNI